MITPDRWWQKRILEIISEEPDDRTIWWFWEPFGGIGKTAFAKYLVAKCGATFLGGKAADMQFAIAKAFGETGRTPEVVVMNFPRSMEGKISYQGLESIKDMLFFSGKYESQMIVGNSPHVIVFANWEPDVSKLSADRWRVECIADAEELRKYQEEQEWLREDARGQMLN